MPTLVLEGYIELVKSSILENLEIIQTSKDVKEIKKKINLLQEDIQRFAEKNIRRAQEC